MASGTPGWTPRVRAMVAEARVGRLATVRPTGKPHLVVITYAVAGDTVVTAIDHKPKSGKELQRLRNLRAQPAASLLVDHYDDDWSTLWWVRLDCEAEVIRAEPRRSQLLSPLVAKYDQYRREPPGGPVILLAVCAATSWPT